MIYVNFYSSVNALGNSTKEVLSNLAKNQSPGILESRNWLPFQESAFYGNVLTDLPSIPGEFKEHNTRNNRLLLFLLEQASDAFQQAISDIPKERIGIVMGTSTSGSDETDHYVCSCVNQSPVPEFYGQMQELGDPSIFLSKYLKTRGPSYTISTACTSSAKAIISGANLLISGLADAVIVGGSDSLARLPICGFSSLEVMSREICKPFAKDRKGITIGEGAGLMVLSTRKSSNLFLAGWGESSDAHHISSPRPDGAGAYKAMKDALEIAGLQPKDISYLNLHGTGTKLNDSSEGHAAGNLFGNINCSSTKNLTGHTLGAAGITEAALLCGLLENQGSILPTQFENITEMDKEFSGLGLLEKPTAIFGNFMMTNNLAFGGNNSSLIFGVANGK